jgi:tRNA U34 5-methylaminomethyl-2-thiouridine-forming methyltransferase MnmC
MRLVTTRDGSKTLYSEGYGQTFHSDRGALSEARHVFLEGSGVAARLASRTPTRVLEVGFGSGLNFLLSADLALSSGAALYYCALDKSLVDADLLTRLGYRDLLAHGALFDALVQGLGDLNAVTGRRLLAVQPGVRLELLLGEATLQALPGAAFDAVYQDAFSPDANPELWSEDFLRRLYQSLKEGGRLSTYSVKGEVRRRLEGLGFSVERRPGPIGGKREMLVAAKPRFHG